MEQEQKEYLKTLLLSFTDNCPNFTEIQKQFNKTFNVSKNITSLKKELTLIAEKENYKILNRQELARIKETKILEYGKSNIVNPDWDTFSLQNQIPITYCQNKFAELLSTEERNNLVYSQISDQEKLQKVLNEYKFTCNKCQRVLIDPIPYKWQDKLECFDCNITHYPEILTLFKEVDLYLLEQKKIHCVCCQTPRTDGNKGNFHLDHINIFDKNNSVCSMVRNGQELNQIKKEIDKCQVLCKPCHHIVTKLEQLLGYSQLKMKITKELIECNINEYQTLYQNQFKYLYEKIKVLTIKLNQT